jgi:hypothetical protein
MLQQAVSALTPPSGGHVWLAVGVTDTRRGMNRLVCRSNRDYAATRTPVIFTFFVANVVTC